MNRAGLVPPHSIEMEQSVLGSMMLEKWALLKGLELLCSEAFYRDAHGIIFRTLQSMAQRDEPVDLVTLTEELRKAGKLDDVGGGEYLVALVHTVPSSHNVATYAGIVDQKFTLRKLIAAATEIQALAWNEDQPTEDVLDKARSLMLGIESNRGGQIRAVSEVVNEAYDWLQAQERGERIFGVAYGIAGLDYLSYGVEATSELTLIGGRPSNGKTCLANQIALHAALDGKRVLYFSQETSSRQLVSRMIFNRSGVDGHRFRMHLWRSDEEHGNAWSRLTAAANELTNLEDLILLQDVRTSIDGLIATAKQQMIARTIDAVIVDYLQIIGTPRGRRNDNRNQELQIITSALKSLTQETKTPVVAVTALSRETEKREGKRPSLADLREGGNQEYDADKVILVHNPPTEGKDIPEQRPALLICAKHKDGPTGEAPAAFLPGSMRFVDYDEYHEPPPEPVREPARRRKVNTDGVYRGGD